MKRWEIRPEWVMADGSRRPGGEAMGPYWSKLHAKWDTESLNGYSWFTPGLGGVEWHLFDRKAERCKP